MPIFTEKMGAVDAITDADFLIKRWPHYRERFDATRNIRELNDDPATRISHWSSEWRSVALMPDTMLEAAKLLEPDFLTNKTKFYTWLRKHPEYSTQPLKLRLK